MFGLLERKRQRERLGFTPRTFLGSGDPALPVHVLAAAESEALSEFILDCRQPIDNDASETMRDLRVDPSEDIFSLRIRRTYMAGTR